MTISSDNVFSREDTAFYTSWQPDNGGIVILHIPGIGEVRMTLAKAEEISADIARQAEYGRWHAMENRKGKNDRGSEQGRQRDGSYS